MRKAACWQFDVRCLPCKEFPAGVKVGNFKTCRHYIQNAVNQALGTNKPTINVALELTEMTPSVPQSIKSLLVRQELTVLIKCNTF